MLFSSITFLYYFLPAVLLLYYIAPKPLKNSVLFLSSLLFYAWGEPVYVFLMLATIICGYVLGILIEKHRGRVLSRVFLTISATAFLAALGFFKYADFFVSNFNAATGLSVPLLRMALPIGISFYTFQILSYTVDVYRGDVAAQRNPIKLATYITMFPQLIAGPIVRYSDIERALGNRTYTFDDAAYGVRRFVIGLSKKVLIANQLGELVEVFRASGDKSVLFFWMYAVAVTLQIYFDFSGYSDMAIGLGRFFGFKFCENFNYPLISKSISEFWRRWHISLGTWFRDYVYIPLGGNRVNKSRWLFNILVVWFLTGFWHGAAWNFIVWGLFFAVLLVGEKFFWGKYISKNDVVSHIYVAFFILISFVIFNTGDMREAGYYLGAMFGMENLPFISGEFIYYFKSYFVLIVIALLGATPCVKSFFNTKCGRVLAVAEPIVLALLLVAVTAFLADGSFNPFLYFRF